MKNKEIIKSLTPIFCKNIVLGNKVNQSCQLVPNIVTDKLFSIFLIIASYSLVYQQNHFFAKKEIYFITRINHYNSIISKPEKVPTYTYKLISKTSNVRLGYTQRLFFFFVQNPGTWVPSLSVQVQHKKNLSSHYSSQHCQLCSISFTLTLVWCCSLSLNTTGTQLFMFCLSKIIF